jgi:glycosyltransferase involved in cell wall biosynthesis
MRVLHVTPYFAPAYVYGGPPRSIAGLCAALARLGVAVDVATTTANGSGAPLPPATAVPVTRDGVVVRYFPWSEPRWLWHATGLRPWLNREIAAYDVVHIHGLWHLPGWHAARLARRHRVPYVVSPRGMLEPEALAIRAGRKAVAFAAIEHQNLISAAWLHATSARECETLEARSLGPPVVLAANGVDVDGLPSADPTPTLNAWKLADRPYLLFLGRVHPIKRLDLLAHAIGRLRNRAFRLVVAGPDEGGHRAQLEPLFAQSGVEVVWTGPVDGAAKADLLTAARVLVLCSDSESFGLAAAEALAAGTPVIATRTLAWEQLEQSGAGRWVEQTPQAIAAALEDLLSDPNEARAMGQRGQLLATRLFTWTTSARTIADGYRRLAADAATARAS